MTVVSLYIGGIFAALVLGVVLGEWNAGRREEQHRSLVAQAAALAAAGRAKRGRADEGRRRS